MEAIVADRIRDAWASHAPLRIAGAGTWLSGGRPVRATQQLSLGALSGIVEYVPGDFVMTVRAGTTLAEIAAVAAEQNQWLPLDPHGTDHGTIGATLATNSAGPHATGFGTARDHVLGVEFINGTGATVRGGGRVVKNVAGFDLVRLSIGAWGTLGVITAATLRLHVRMPAETVVMPMDPEASAIAHMARALRGLTVAPLAAELLNESMAHALGLPSMALLVRIGGNAASLRAQREELAAISAYQSADGALWTQFRAVAGPADAVWRLSARAPDFAATWAAAQEAGNPLNDLRMHGSVLRGVVRCIAPGALNGARDSQVTQALTAPFAGRRVGEALPDVAWKLVPGSAGGPLSRRIRAAFDPACILNPGVLGELS